MAALLLFVSVTLYTLAVHPVGVFLPFGESAVPYVYVFPSNDTLYDGVNFDPTSLAPAAESDTEHVGVGFDGYNSFVRIFCIISNTDTPDSIVPSEIFIFPTEV